MPAVFNARYAVRHYECDANGHLNNANYIRYMEETAFHASADVGYDRARYDALGCLWLARETHIEYLAPVVYGDTLEVRTWVGDFRRVRSRRFYEFRKVNTDSLIARANTDWVYIERETQRPTVVPAEMIAAFVPEGLQEAAQPRRREPVPPPPPNVFAMGRRVEWRDIDTAQHVNNAVYFNYIEEAGLQVANHYGWPYTRSQAAGWGAIARENHIEYLGQARLGDELEVRTWVTMHGRASADRYYAITRPADGAHIASARTQWVWVDLRTHRPIRIPEDFLADFAENIVR